MWIPKQRYVLQREYVGSWLANQRVRSYRLQATQPIADAYTQRSRSVRHIVNRGHQQDAGGRGKSDGDQCSRHSESPLDEPCDRGNHNVYERESGQCDYRDQTEKAGEVSRATEKAYGTHENEKDG